MITSYNKIKPIKKLDKVLSELDVLFDEFESNPEKIKVNCPFCDCKMHQMLFHIKIVIIKDVKNVNFYLSPRITENWLLFINLCKKSLS